MSEVTISHEQRTDKGSEKSKPFSAAAIEILLLSQFGNDDESLVGEDYLSGNEEGCDVSSD